MTLDQVRQLLLRRAAKFAGKRANATGINGWCRKHGANNAHASDFLNGKRLPTTDILNGLGLEWRIVRKSPQALEARKGQDPARGLIAEGDDIAVREADAPNTGGTHAQ